MRASSTEPIVTHCRAALFGTQFADEEGIIQLKDRRTMSGTPTTTNSTMTAEHEHNAAGRYRTLLLIGPPGAGKGTLGRCEH
jgi:hypothetical protein